MTSRTMRAPGFSFLALMTWLCAAPAGAQVEAPRWYLEEVSRVGTVDGPLALTDVISATTTIDNSTLYVAQPQESAIWLIDVARGELLRKVGRSGEGPGEFRRLDYLGWKEDTLYATDGHAGRVNLFTRDGEFLRDLRLTPTNLTDPPQLAFPVAYADSGRLVVQTRLNTMSIAEGRSTQDPVGLLTADGTVVRILAARDLVGTHATVPLGRAVHWMYQPFVVRNLVGIDRRRAAVALITQPVGEEPPGTFKVRLVRTDGTVAFDRSYRYDPQPIPPAYRDSVYLDMAEVYAETGFVSPQQAGALVREHMNIPVYFPPIADVVLSDEGDIWLQLRGAGGSTAWWIVLDQAGEIRARALAPAEVKLLTVGESHAWARLYDDLEVPRLVQYRIRR